MSEAAEDPLALALLEWSDGYEKHHAFTGEANASERRIIELVGDRPRPQLDCVLYRGTGIADGIPTRIVSGDCTSIEPSRRLFTSWTKDRQIAKNFLDDALEDNQSAVLLAVHSSQLDVLVDLTEFPLLGDEQEILVLSGAVPVSPDNVLEAWEYDGNACRPVDRTEARRLAMSP